MLTILLILALVALAAVHFRLLTRFRNLEMRHALLGRELSERKKDFERKLAEASAQQTLVFDSMAEGVLILGPDGRIQLANKAVINLLGLHGDVRGRLLMEVVRNYALDNLSQRLAQEGEPLEFELKLSGPRKAILDVTSSALRTADELEDGVILVFHDLTRLRQLETIRTDFVANVSHELRTPLSVIKGYVETLLDHPGQPAETTERFLKTIEKHTERLVLLIEDLLTLSQLESGNLSLTLQSTKLRPLVNGVVEDLRHKAQERNMTVVNEIPGMLEADCDAARIEQVVCNLVDNAIKYGHVGGHVCVSGSIDESQTEVRITVRDDGPGIPIEAQSRVFERFYRVDPARSREKGGTGLGLSIVKHITQLHRGKVWLESKPGEGSTFHIALPVHHVDREQSVEPR